MNIAIIGATGLVGGMFLKILEERNFKIDKLFLFASEKSDGKEIIFKNKKYIVKKLEYDIFEKNKINLALFSAGKEISKKFAILAAKNNCVVIDNSSAWRMNDKVPLVVPEVNPEDLKNHKNIIANPNCSTIQLVVAIKKIHDVFKIKRIVISTYQAVSGAGIFGINDLKNDDNKKFKYSIVNNCLPQIDNFDLETKYTLEELKLINETKKILHAPEINITATAVRVPVINSHGESINLELRRDFDIKEIFDILRNTPGVAIQDDIKNEIYPLAKNASGKDLVFVGRIRRDFSIKSGLNFWIVADNIRKGAATNAVQIAERLI
ncbi:MAG: aspartate-semialdehyde dehydrogenase [Clostridiales bacterium]|jgi:aspartate-semialdehyde dehydrogenase|nr:aspartate-semialdehyde dehydrogenase [Clostridiales bacterium]